MGHYLEVGLIIFTLMRGKLIIKFSFLQIILNNYFVRPGPVSSLTGIQFGDNGSQNFVTEENGVAVATTQVFFISLKELFEEST